MNPKAPINNMANIKEDTKTAVLSLVGGTVKNYEELMDYLFKANIVDERLCKIALIRKRYYELCQENKDMKYVEAKFICETEFNVSATFVDKAIYRYRKVDFGNGINLFPKPTSSQ